MELKQVILVRQDLKMPKGKLSVQVAHAAVESALISDSNIVKGWTSQGMKKVVLKVKNKREMIKYKKLAEKMNLRPVLITDAARTFFKKPTVTCLAIGPDTEEKIDKITGDLKMIY